ncbi:MAG: transcriptional regulator [Thermoplasmata archaeon]|nr:transcriptional regulator [Thermoplasmata archaeon]
MGIEDEVSPNAVKVYKAMKDMGFTTEEKLGAAERITMTTRLPKTMVMNALQELQTKGYARRKARDKVAGYHIVVK